MATSPLLIILLRQALSKGPSGTLRQQAVASQLPTSPQCGPECQRSGVWYDRRRALLPMHGKNLTRLIPFEGLRRPQANALKARVAP
jgi:hypothetical protein